MQATANPMIDTPTQCDRHTAFVLFHAIQKKVQAALLDIQTVIQRSQSLKRYPYALFYKRTLAPVASSTPPPTEGSEIRNTIYERTSDTLANIKFESESDNLDIIAMIIDSCLRYQIAIRNLVKLAQYLTESLDRFNKMHLLYDDMLQRLQNEKNRSTAPGSDEPLAIDSLHESSASTAPTITQFTEVQNNLEITKETLQKFLNQVPSQLASLHVEIGLMNIYDNIDESVKLYRFFTNPYIKSLIGQATTSKRLQHAYRLMRHTWNELLPSHL